MTKKTSTAKVDKQKYKDYKFVADNFYKGAEVAYEYEYFNAAGVLLVHAAIAYTDALTIKLSGTKSRGTDHHEIVTLLQSTVENNTANNSARNKLFKIIEHKTRVSYSGDIYSKKDIDEIRKLAERYKVWIEDQLSK